MSSALARRQNAEQLYQEDKELADVARAMQTRGIRVDTRKRRELDVLLKARMASYLGKLRSASGQPNLEPNKLDHLRKAIFRILHGPVLFRSNKILPGRTQGLPSTGRETLHTLAAMQSGAGNFCRLLLSWRKAQKLRAVYVTGIDVEDDGAVHPSWRSWGTVTGRFAPRNPNLANLPREDPDDDSPRRIKEMYIPRKGMVFIGYDSKQIEMRLAAYLSNDPELIRAVESEDVHAVNAEVLWGELPDKEAQPVLWKKLRTAGKSSGFAMNYRASAEAVWKKLREEGFENVEMHQVVAMLNRLKRRYHRYFEWQDEELAKVAERGWMETIDHRVRWFGHTPISTEVANFPIQGGAAAVINKVARVLGRELPRFGAHLIAQVHDHLLTEAPARQANKAAKLIKQVAEEPLIINGRECVFPIEIAISDKNWSCV